MGRQSTECCLPIEASEMSYGASPESWRRFHIQSKVAVASHCSGSCAVRLDLYQRHHQHTQVAIVRPALPANPAPASCALLYLTHPHSPLSPATLLLAFLCFLSLPDHFSHRDRPRLNRDHCFLLLYSFPPPHQSRIPCSIRADRRPN